MRLACVPSGAGGRVTRSPPLQAAAPVDLPLTAWHVAAVPHQSLATGAELAQHQSLAMGVELVQQHRHAAAVAGRKACQCHCSPRALGSPVPQRPVVAEEVEAACQDRTVATVALLEAAVAVGTSRCRLAVVAAAVGART